MCKGFNVSEGGRGQKTILSHEIIISAINIVFHALFVITIFTTARRGGWFCKVLSSILQRICLRHREVKCPVQSLIVSGVGMGFHAGLWWKAYIYFFVNHTAFTSPLGRYSTLGIRVQEGNMVDPLPSYTEKCHVLLLRVPSTAIFLQRGTVPHSPHIHLWLGYPQSYA